MHRGKIENDELYRFTLAFRERLPKEVRLYTYDLLLDNETLHDLAAFQCTPRLHFENAHAGQEAAACKLDFASMDEIVAKEIATRFYMLWDDYRCYGLEFFYLTLQHDYLQVGIRPCEVAIRMLKIFIDPSTMVQPMKVDALYPILRPEQKRSKNFTLHVHVRNGFSWERESSRLPGKLSCTLRLLEPIIDEAKRLLPNVIVCVELHGSVWVSVYEMYKTSTEAQFEETARYYERHAKQWKDYSRTQNAGNSNWRPVQVPGLCLREP